MTPKEAARAIRGKKEQYAEAIHQIVKRDPWVPIVFRDGVKRRMSYTLSAVEEVFEKTGLVINTGDIQPPDLSRMDILLLMLGAGLRSEDAAITDEWVKANFYIAHRDYYRACVMEAMEALQPSLEFLENLFGDTDTETGDGKKDNVEEMPSPLSETPTS